MADVRGGCLKAVAWAFGGFLALVVLGFIYLSLFPPLGSTETGYLSRREERRVALSGPGSSATHELSVGAGRGVYGTESERFEPLSVRVTVRTEAGAPLTVQVLPTDGHPLEGLAITEAGTASWAIDCQQPTDERPCPRDYLLVVTASGAAAGDVEAVLEVFAEQRFPTYVGTPFAVGIDVALERRQDADDDGWQLAETSGTLTLAPDAPVALVTIEAPGSSPSGAGGIVLAASADRDGPATPTGLRAPPPVRVALIGGDGAVLADLGVRPGTESAVAIPPGSGHYRLVAWWQDRADHAYEVSWRMAVAAAGTSGLTLAATDETHPEPVGSTMTAAGVIAVGGPGSSDRIQDLPVHVDIGLNGGTDSLPPMAGVLRLRLLVVNEDLPEPIAIQLVPARGAELATAAPLPIMLEPGVAREIVLEATPGCPATACETWAVLPVGRDGTSGALTLPEVVRIEWQASLQLWPLDPFGSAAP
jgi:hypothetical protein